MQPFVLLSTITTTPQEPHLEKISLVPFSFGTTLMCLKSLRTKQKSKEQGTELTEIPENIKNSQSQVTRTQILNWSKCTIPKAGKSEQSFGDAPKPDGFSHKYSRDTAGLKTHAIFPMKTWQPITFFFEVGINLCTQACTSDKTRSFRADQGVRPSLVLWLEEGLKQKHSHRVSTEKLRDKLGWEIHLLSK